MRLIIGLIISLVIISSIALALDPPENITIDAGLEWIYLNWSDITAPNDKVYLDSCSSCNGNMTVNGSLFADYFCLFNDNCISTWPTGGGGGAGDKWIDEGLFISPNSSYADNVVVYGYIKADDWTNVSITESQISDLSHTVDTTIGNCSGSGSCNNIFYQGDLLNCSNVANSTSDLCTIVDTDTTIGNCSGDGSCNILYANGTLTDAKFCTYNGTTINCNSDGGGGETADIWVNESGDNMTGDLGVVGNVNVSYNLSAGFYLADTLGYDLIDDGSNLLMDTNVADNNYFGIGTIGAFLQLYSNPNVANGYLLFTVTETQGADTYINFYEGGTGHNRLWSSGSIRIGGPEGYLCSNIPSPLPCDTPNEGANLIVEGSIFTNRSILAMDWSNVSLTSDQVADNWVNASGDTMTGHLNMSEKNITSIDYTCFNPECSRYIYDNGTHLIIQT